ncbi:dihydrolipoamide acetyltransferase family protein [Cryobacterium ruanii]|uniref:Dihydrolipoamide acetyltransferase component of pyruvate dehydrogenase complex n=1 Tax=Cryobacterium ruanii TaxID=1259197 RepID=A0A4R9AT57_9MICO|nr:dihydrolipoamide acetyltransferase family protein [Cryobacterium ruanii]TFD69460.1 2-oxo acid dehydrogenase subunit E2 [Cryobacterium ruanii]
MVDLPLTMPKMSMTMEEGTMVAWLKNEGDFVKAGEAICEVATDKVDMEVESPFDGTLARIMAFENDVIKVGVAIGMITTDADDLLGGVFDEPVPEAYVEPVRPIKSAIVAPEAAAILAVPASTPVAATLAATPAPVVTAASAATAEWMPAVPLARVIAREHGLELRTIMPTGPWGTIRVADVEGAIFGTTGAPIARAVPAHIVAPAPAPAPVPEAVVAPAADAPSIDAAAGRRRRTRLQVARVMTASALVPQFTAFLELDLSKLARVRKTELGGASWTALLVRAQALALRGLPQLNATWTTDGAVPKDDIGIALAIDAPNGLLAPVLRNPDAVPLAELVREINEVIVAARDGKTDPSRLTGGTSVFSNLGGLGVDSFNALLTPPQATALSAGAVKDRIVITDGAFGARLTCIVGITVDHRVADGGDAARFLASLKEIVSTPQRLLDGIVS